MAANKEQMNIVIAGHVDHGKSTVIGRMLADSGSLPQGKLEHIRALCERNSKPFEYAFLLDALKDEMAQGITIDAARVFFHTARREYIIIDAPGHIEFLKNMVTGASRAEAALLVIDAEEGIRENSRRHGYMLRMLGIDQIAVLVNKMDLVGYDQGRFQDIAREYTAFLRDIEVTPAAIIPVSGREGDNIVAASPRMPWHTGGAALSVLDGFSQSKPLIDKPFRMPVQGVYKFTNFGDTRRLVAGTVDAGELRVGDEVVFYPSGKRSRVQSIDAFNRPPQERAEAGQATAFTLDEQIYITRGEIAARADQPVPRVTTHLRVSLFWMGRNPMTRDKEYVIKIGTEKVPVTLEKILAVIDASDLKSSADKERIERHDVAECILKTRRAVAFDLAVQGTPTGRFVIVDDYEIRGGGIIREDLHDELETVRSQVLLRNLKWETSMISPDRRAEKYNQRATLIVVTGSKDRNKKNLAKALESRLFEDGKVVYFVGISNVLYGVDADIKTPGEIGDRPEHLRRLAEVANLMLDAGALLIVTATGLTADDMTIIDTVLGDNMALVVWVGDRDEAHINYDLHIEDGADTVSAVDAVKNLLQDRNIIYRP